MTVNTHHKYLYENHDLVLDKVRTITSIQSFPPDMDSMLRLLAFYFISFLK